LAILSRNRYAEEAEDKKNSRVFKSLHNEYRFV
jgi:deoxyadenosine/deoxycytidine kinase